jgi:hypothetical protein
MLMSSCVAFCCMSCRTASTAFDITACSRARHARPTSPASANCWRHQRRRPNPSRPQSRPLNSRPVLAAAGACASSRPSNAGCSRGRRHAIQQQPGRRRDPAQFIPTQCRRQVVSADNTSRALRIAGFVRNTNPCCDRHKVRSKASDVGRERLDIFSLCASNEAQRTARPRAPAQPKHQIPITRALHIAGSFLGDFPTPDGVRNSSRIRTGRFGASDDDKQRRLLLENVDGG